jgi:hypothetical protein
MMLPQWSAVKVILDDQCGIASHYLILINMIWLKFYGVAKWDIGTVNSTTSAFKLSVDCGHEKGLDEISLITFSDVASKI